MENKRIIVFAGLPGSGKSTLCDNYTIRGYVRVSQDEQGKHGHRVVYEEALARRDNIIIDRCGFNVEQRQRYLKAAKELGYKTIIIWLQTPPEECIKRIKNRKGHPNLDSEKNLDKIEKVVMDFHKDFVAPTEVEADEVLKI